MEVVKGPDLCGPGGSHLVVVGSKVIEAGRKTPPNVPFFDQECEGLQAAQEATRVQTACERTVLVVLTSYALLNFLLKDCFPAANTHSRFRRRQL